MKSIFARRLLPAISLGALGQLAASLMAAPVTIPDFSFEENQLSSGAFTYDVSPWQRAGYSSGQAFEEFISGFASHGTDHLGIEPSTQSSRYIYQDLPATYQANTTYTLRVAVGHRAGVSTSGNISRYRLATPSASLVTGNYDAFANVASGAFADAPPVVLNTAVNTGAVGQTIRIRLEARGSGRSHFDNIRLDATSNVTNVPATLVNTAATSIGQTTATLNGNVTSSGIAAPSITLFYGTSDGGTNAAAWQQSINLPGTHSGVFSSAVSGLTPNTAYFFTARATNSAGVSWASPSLGFETLPTTATITQGTATNLGATTASLPVTISSTGGDTPTVTMFYGTSDGGTNASAWAASVNLGTLTGSSQANISALSPSTTYRFRARATNSAGTSWANTTGSFVTLPVTVPVITARPAQSITGKTAVIVGEVTSTGNETPAITLFFGPGDGGTNAAAWSSSVNLGPQSGVFQQLVTQLAPETTHHFRFRATNRAGSSWSDTGLFTTVAYTPAPPVITEIHYAPADDPVAGPVRHEFVEIHNPGDAPIDFSGWTLDGAVQFVFPGGTVLQPGAYLCVAQDPAAFQSKFGFQPLGPFSGKLSNEGEAVALRNAAGETRDEVDYKPGFPWPTYAKGTGPSIELIHPSLDNSLGGSWRSGGTVTATETVFVAASSSDWKYLRGTAEPSTPAESWRGLGFDDTAWTTASAPIGYGGYTTATTINGMQSVHSTLYFRKRFQIAAGNIPDALTLRIKYDDGAIVWINGTEVARLNSPAGEVPFDGTALADHPVSDWETITLTNADAYLRGGDNIVTVQGLNLTAGSSDFFLDLSLSSFVNTGITTPGAQNSVFATTGRIPPQIRQVVHTPVQPAGGIPVTITARISDPDGVGTVTCAYQTVNPGSYIRKTDSAYAASWTTINMRDDGTDGDPVADDGIFTCVIPAGVQTHRRLVRYRVTAADLTGNQVRVPYADDEQPNFAYFVYNGVPSWTGAMRPTSFNGFAATTPRTFDAAVLNSIQPYHLIANAIDVEDCQYNSYSQNTRFTGTFVYDGIVYDHIQFKVRGIGSTYNTGKNKWNIFFNRARDLQARDNRGNKYKETWNNLLLNANACPWATVNRGAAGIEEASCARIYELAGNTNFRTHYVHWRVIDSATEQSPTSQYDSDLWGLYLGLEPTESNLLDERGLPDGSIYAIEGNTGDKKHQGEGQPVDSSDWTAFRSAITTPGQSEAWYRANMDLPKLYTFLALNRLTGNVDVRPGDNYRYYHRTSDNRWEILAYDLDMQFIAAHHWGGSIDGVFVSGQPNSIIPVLRHPAIALEYRNRCRELLDLVASDPSPNGGQIGQLIDEYARIVDPAGSNGNSWAYLDAHLWNLHPETTGSGSNTGQNNSRGNFFRANYSDGTRGVGGSVVTNTWIRTRDDPDGDGFSDFQALADWFVRFSTDTYPAAAAPWVRKATYTAGGGNDSDPNRQRGYGYQYLRFESLYGGYADSRNEPARAPDLDFPNKPVITYTGSPGHPANDIRFSSSAFSDPNGNGTFAAMQWRLAEIAAPGIAGYTPDMERRYEIEATWESGDLPSFTAETQFPVSSLRPGATYRARVRHKDTSGRYSHWSDPLQFTATTPDVSVWKDNLMITEIMYNPAVPSAAETAAGGSAFNNDYEFIEIRNISPTITLDLNGIRFTKGVDFDFEGSSITSLAPGAFAVVVKHLPSFTARHGPGLPVAGVWDVSDNLSNSGEEIKLSYGAGTTVQHINPTGLVRYDQPPWPTTPDGNGPSLTLKDPFSRPDHDLASNWRASNTLFGSPGTSDNFVTITLSNLNHWYDRTPKTAATVTDPPGIAVNLSYNGSPTPPTDGGSYLVRAVSADPRYEGMASGTLIIAAAPQTIGFTVPSSHPFDSGPLALSATSTSELPVSFAVVSGPASLAGNSLVPQGAGEVILRASQPGNGNYQPAPPVEQTLALTTSYQESAWKSLHFSPAELADPALSGPLADLDGDGLPNLVEFSMNLDPKNSDRHRGLCVYREVESAGQRYPAMAIRRRISHPDLQSTVEASLDFVDWSTPEPVEHGSPLLNGDGTETIILRSPLPLSSESRQWLRLRVTGP